MYYSKVIDGILAPKVVCTQPRQKPVKENATRVSNTLGVPIFQGKEKTNNFFIQYKFKGKKHQQRIHFPSLTFITGDSLMLELDDPILKVKTKNKDNIKNYREENQYDIIIIDEAHEHKKHMDLLLTFLKLPIATNNSLRLVVVSATMDDDEPRYRRFFRDINDNKKFPLNTWIWDDKIDRINVDRRYHVAPPGAGTKYEIKEHYRPLSTNVESEMYEKIKEIVTEILSKSSEGDILIFQPGVKEITETITILNNSIPSNVYSFPLYKKLDDNKQEPTSNLGLRRKIRIDKSVDFASAKDLTNGNNVYTRFIIVATNIAEASVTIPGLKYVIETGTEKSQIYDYMKRNERIFKDTISETSRIQRKGRVGRISPGEVYYLYKKGTTENNKIPYEFSRMKIDDILYRYLRENEENEDIMSINDISKPCTNCDFKLDTIQSPSLKKILQKQYFIGGDKYYSYYGDNSAYDYQNYQKPYIYYQTGINASTINDNDGDFFIIHPEELDLQRNINGDITGIKNSNINKGLKFKRTAKYKGKISSKKMESFWEILLDYMYICVNKNRDLIKTETGRFFSKNSESLKINDPNLFRTAIYGLAISYQDIFKLCALCEVIGFDLSKLFVNLDEKTSSITLLYEKFGNNIKSDGEIIMRILNSYHEILVNDKIMDNNLFNVKYVYGEELQKQKTRLKSEHIIELLGKQKNYSKELKDKIDMSEENIKKIVDNYVEIIENNIVKEIQYSKEIKNWCDNNYIDYDVIIEYTEKYLNIISSYLKINNEEGEIYTFIENLKKKFNSINSVYKINKMTTSLIFGFPQNIAVNINNTNRYLSLYAPNYQNIFTITAFTPTKPKSFVSKQNLSEYVLYLESNIEKNEIMMIFNINIKDIILLAHIYNPEFIIDDDKASFIEDKIKKYENAVKLKKPSIEKFRLTNTGIEQNNVMVNYVQTLNKVKNDLINNKHNIYVNLEFIKSLDPMMKDLSRVNTQARLQV